MKMSRPVGLRARRGSPSVGMCSLGSGVVDTGSTAVGHPRLSFSYVYVSVCRSPRYTHPLPLGTVTPNFFLIMFCFLLSKWLKGVGSEKEFWWFIAR